MKRSTKLSIGFGVLLLICFMGSTSAAVSSGDKYQFDVKINVVSEEMGIDETVNGKLTLTVTEVSDSSITYDMKWDVEGYSSIYSDETGVTTSLSDSICAESGQYFISPECSEKSSIFTFEGTEMTYEYDDDGVLQKSDYSMVYSGMEYNTTIQRASGGVPGYPAFILGILTLAGIGIVMKRRK